MERASSPRFGAMVTAMVTPFDRSGALDVDGAVTLARWLADNGSDGLVVAGTTGEGPVLTDAEVTELFEAVARAVTVPVLAGTGRTNDTAHSIELTRLAAAAGVAGALVVTPYYNRLRRKVAWPPTSRRWRPAPRCRSCCTTSRFGLAGASSSTPCCAWPKCPTSWGSSTPRETWWGRPPWWTELRRPSRSTAVTTH